MNLTDLIIQNEGLIYNIANHFKGYVEMEDLYQAGCKGIINAYKNYDPTKSKFSTYAYSYIMGEMKLLVNNNSVLKTNRRLNSLKIKIEKANILLAQKLNRYPTTKELSDFLEIDENLIIEVQKANIKIKSIDDFVYDDVCMHEVISDKMQDIDSLIYLKEQILALEEPDRTIMIQRYYEDMTQSEVANNLGLTQVNVSRRESKTLKKLRANYN